ncbi:MAG: hypothetical protein QXX95_05710 [Nitrososphaerales archaeon]
MVEKKELAVLISRDGKAKYLKVPEDKLEAVIELRKKYLATLLKRPVDRDKIREIINQVESICYKIDYKECQKLETITFIDSKL